MHGLRYTVRNVPPAVDRVIRGRAKREGKSLNAVLLEALMVQTLGSADATRPDHDVLDRLRGANTLDSDFDVAIEDQSKPDGWSL